MNTLMGRTALVAFLLSACGTGVDRTKDVDAKVMSKKDTKASGNKEAERVDAPKLDKPMFLVARQKAEDLDRWREEFAARERDRIGAGVRHHVLMKDADRQGEVLISLLTSDVAKSTAFLAGSRDVTLHAEDGAEPSSDITQWAPVSAKPPPLGPEPAVGAVLVHRVEDFAAWKKVHDSDLGSRKAAGVIAEGVMQDPGDPNRVFVHLDGQDLSNIRELLGSRGFKQRLRDAGVVETRTTFVHYVDAKVYDVPAAARANPKAPPTGDEPKE